MGARNLTDDEWTAVAIRYEAGEKPRLIADSLDISIGSLNWNMLRLGADKPNAKPLPSQARGPVVVKRGKFEVRHFSADEDTKIKAWSTEGLGNTAIGRRIGRRPNSVKGRLMTLARHDARNEGAHA